MNNLPIGVFDSGVGGLSVAKQLIDLLPNENIVYLGDTGRVPYGIHTTETIRKYTDDDLAFLLSQNVKAIIAACGTVSSAVTESTVAALPVPYLGIIEPTARAAAAATRNGKIGVIATNATVNSRAFENSIAAINPELEVIGQGCPKLVTIVENADIDFENKIAREALTEYLAPIVEKGADVLILGCTHFPLLAPIVADLLGDGVTLIDSGLASAIELKNILAEKNLLNPSTEPGSQQYYVTASTEAFSKVAKQFLGFETGEMTKKVVLEPQL